MIQHSKHDYQCQAGFSWDNLDLKGIEYLLDFWLNEIYNFLLSRIVENTDNVLVINYLQEVVIHIWILPVTHRIQEQ